MDADPRAFLDYVSRRNDAIQATLAEAHGWKIARYFHECPATCQHGSLDPKDHVPLKADQGPIHDVLVENNLFNGGGYTVYWYDANFKSTKGTVRNNRLRRPYP